jgi:hypothetical protein
MQSPVLAILWENWQLTRIEVAQRLAQGIVLAAAVMGALAAFGPTDPNAARFALGILLMTSAPLSLAVARLNGGRFMDGYRPGYPFSFLFTRPVRTVVLVGAPMAYLVVSAVAVYIVAALVLRTIFGYPFLSLPLAAWIAAFHTAQWAVQWGTRNKTVQWIGSLAAGLGFTALGAWRAQEWPARLDVSLGDYALLAAIGVSLFALTVAGVARQRRGDAREAIPRTVEWRGFSDWLAGLFRVACPTSSTTLAQMWFDLKSSGLPVLAIGLALAIVIPLVFVVTTRLDIVLAGFYAQPATRMAAVIVAVFALPAVLLRSGNAFGIRARQGRTYASAFDATQACGTARMAGLKVLVRSVCLLAALAAVGASVWVSASVIPFDVLEDNDTFIEKSRSPLSAWMRVLQAGVEALSAREQIALAFVAFIAVAVMVAVRASLTALRARYPGRVNITGSLLLLYGLLLVLRAPDGQGGNGLDVVFMEALVAATPWMTTAAIALATVSLFWRSLAERLLTLRSAAAALLTWAAFAAAWVTVLGAAGVQLVLRVLAGVQLASVPAMDAGWVLFPVLLPLMVGVLAPWSLSRVRHT